MIVTFLETGNGRVVVNAVSPLLVGNFKNTVAAGFTTLLQLLLPRNEQNEIINGTYSGEYQIQAYDTTTGDVFSRLVQLVLNHFGGVTTVIGATSLALTRTGTLVAAADMVSIALSGDVNIEFDPTTANSVNQSGLGIFLTL